MQSREGLYIIGSMPENEQSRLLSGVAGIESDLTRFSAGWDNEEATASIERHIDTVRSLSTDSYLLEKLASLSASAKELFSLRTRHDSDADRIKGDMKTYCRDLRDWAETVRNDGL